MIGNHERFKNIASGWQNYAIALAVFFGGGWTLSTFLLLDEYGLRSIENELRKRELAVPAVLNMELQVNPLHLPGSQKRFLAIQLMITNVGKYRARFKTSDARL